MEKVLLLLMALGKASEICEFFMCADQSASIPSSFVNDNFCDCPDGSDETRTSACKNKLFTCPEKKIHSNWVHDGICGNILLRLL